MRIPISSPAELGLVVRATRKAQGLRLDDAAGFAGVGPVFAGNVERGKATVQLGLVLKLLQQLGLKVIIDAPDVAEATLAELRARGSHTKRTRTRKVPGT
jgi:transcriptional regulator with XRE-family HTH domain